MNCFVLFFFFTNSCEKGASIVAVLCYPQESLASVCVCVQAPNAVYCVVVTCGSHNVVLVIKYRDGAGTHDGGMGGDATH